MSHADAMNILAESCGCAVPPWEDCIHTAGEPEQVSLLPTDSMEALIREAYDQGFADGLAEAERRHAQIQYLLHCSGGNA